MRFPLPALPDRLAKALAARGHKSLLLSAHAIARLRERCGPLTPDQIATLVADLFLESSALERWSTRKHHHGHRVTLIIKLDDGICATVLHYGQSQYEQINRHCREAERRRRIAAGRAPRRRPREDDAA